MTALTLRTPEIRWISVDPGETTGWATWVGTELEDLGQTPMWEFAQDIAHAVFSLPDDPDFWKRWGPERSTFGRIEGIVCEDFRLYPWKLKELEWDAVRTARVIGALELVARLADITFVLQGAAIKERAEAASAENLFITPLHENRHANDAVRHGVYYGASQSPNFAVPEKVRG